jgi:hypothetical protein
LCFLVSRILNENPVIVRNEEFSSGEERAVKTGQEEWDEEWNEDLVRRGIEWVRFM